ncbi:MAG: O-antigen ligase family protein [Solirubrobacterales bacterium]
MEAFRHPQLGARVSDLAAWLVPLLLIVYLGLSNGGYDPIARSEVGVAVWWAVLIGTALSLLPAAGGSRPARAILVLAVAFAGWTALSLTWTESDERTATELARASTYLGVFVFALAVQGRGRWRHILNGVTAGVVVVCGLAALSRMEPSWFPEQTAGKYLTGIQIESRLAYPLNYPSALGALAAIGIPLALAATSSARTIAGQALAAAAIPVVVLALWLTSSGLSVPAGVIALAIFFVLAPDRLPKLVTLAVAGTGSAILFLAVARRDELDRGLAGGEAEAQGDELLLITLAVCAGVGLVQAALSRWARHAERPGWLRIPRRQASIAAAVGLVVAVFAGVAAGAPSQLEDEWQSLKGRGAETDPQQSSRGAQILDFSGSGRYEFWEASVDANATDPWKGIGPGTFDLWWLRHGSYAAYVRDAHSLYLETLGELGIIGLVLVGGFSAGILGFGAWRALRAPPDLRLGIAAATAGCGAFIAAALVDWMWEFGVLAVVFFALAAIACAAGEEPRDRSRERGFGFPLWRRYGGRIAITALSLAGLAAIAQPLWGAVTIERSYDAAAEGRLGDALDDAQDAVSAQPYAATPRMQEALLLERRGDIKQAVEAARAATKREKTNWLTWFVLSRIESRSGDAADAEAALRRARQLNPRSPTVAEPTVPGRVAA